MYQYYELQPRKFSNCNLVGEGGFGTVYKGQLADGTLIAVKRLDRHGMYSNSLHMSVSILSFKL